MLPASLGALSLNAPPLVLDLLALPRPLVFAIFALLPVDMRLRCSRVNRAWRALLADTSFWESLDLSVRSFRFLSPALLRAAVAKAGGQLRTLDLTGQLVEDTNDFCRLRTLVAANAATLTELRTGQVWSFENICALLKAGPALKILEGTLSMNCDQHSRAMLRNEPPFQPLRLRSLHLMCPSDAIALSSDLRCHTWLEKLRLFSAALNTAAAMGAIADACIALRLRGLELVNCHVAPAGLPELARLVAAGALRELVVDNYGAEMIADEADESTGLFVDTL